MIFTNKHVVIAMLVAPVLAVVAWLATGQFAGETPQPAVAGQSYPLLEQSNCRYSSGACDVENESFKLRLTASGDDGGLLLTAAHPLDSAVLGVSLPDAESEPTVMRAVDGQGLEWRVMLERAPDSEQRIRLVAMAGGSSYFADVSTAFLQPADD